MTRDEHLEWAKKRALEYVDRGELPEAVTSMGSDLRKHPELDRNHVNQPLLLIAMMFEIQKGPDAVRRWINGFH